MKLTTQLLLLGVSAKDSLIIQARCLGHDLRANIAIMTAFSLPALMMVMGVAVDYSSLYSAKSDLQQLADSAALAAAREMALINAEKVTIRQVARNYVKANKKGQAGRFYSGISVKTKIDLDVSTLSVTISGKKKNLFGGFLQPEFTTINAFARARAVGDVSVCMIGLDPRKKSTIKLENNAKIVANDCGIYSNSISKKGINLKNSASITANFICTTGGAIRTKGTFDPQPVTDCPPAPDPLRSRAPLVVNGCDYNNTVIKNEDLRLDPGIYCGGLLIKGTSIVTFRPGIYIIKDGIFKVTGTATASGENTGFYFTGDAARLVFDKNTHISFSAPSTGGMAGMLFFQNPRSSAPSDDDGDNTTGRAGRFEIRSNDARKLLGTIYLPQGKLFVKSTSPVSDQSAYTVVIARRIQFFAGPTFVLNSDFGATNIPLPAGIANETSRIYLDK